MKNWYIAITEENRSELLEWWNGKSIGCRSPLVGEYLMSKNPKDYSCYWSRKDTNNHGLNWQQEYELITLEQFRQITNLVPEHWYIEVTEENKEELNRWRLKVATAYRDYILRAGHTLLSMLSRHSNDGSYFYTDNASVVRDLEDYADYQEITLEQFRQITNQAPKTMTKSIRISRELLNEYYEASTGEQKAYLAEHFKLDGTTTDEAIRGLYELACGDWKPKIKANHHECFLEDSKYFDFSEHTKKYGCDSIVSNNVADSLGLCRDFIQVRGVTENRDRSFYLCNDYNWELINEGRVMVLIPTKKVK